MPIFTALRVCCARAMSGQTADTPTAPMKSRRRMCPPEGHVRTVVAIVTLFAPNSKLRGSAQDRNPTSAKRCLHVYHSPGHQADGGSLAEIFRVRRATKWLLLYA